MNNKRHNIDTIAEVLIDKLNAMEKTARRIEEASSKELKVDTSGLELNTELLKDISENYLHRIEQDKIKRLTLPKWIVIVFVYMCAICTFSIALNVYQKLAYDKLEDTAIIWYKKANNKGE